MLPIMDDKVIPVTLVGHLVQESEINSVLLIFSEINKQQGLPSIL